MIDEGEKFSQRKFTEGVALSGKKDFIMTKLWRDLNGAEGD